MDGWRRDAEEPLDIGLCRRAAVHQRVGVNERQILTLLWVNSGADSPAPWVRTWSAGPGASCAPTAPRLALDRRLASEGDPGQLVPRHIGSDCLILGGMETWEVVAFDENDDGARHAGFA